MLSLPDRSERDSPNGDVHVTPQRRRRRQKAIHGMLPEAAAQQARNVGLRQPAPLCHRGLLGAALTDDFVNAGDEFRL